MKKIIFVLLAMICITAVAVADSTWTCPKCGQTGNTSNFCPSCGAARPAESWTCSTCGKTGNAGNYCINCGAARSSAATQTIYARAAQKLALNDGPGTKRYFRELGTYNVQGQLVEVLAKAWDPNNDIWWVKVRLPDRATVGWTGAKRLDDSSYDLNAVPTEYWTYK